MSSLRLSLVFCTIMLLAAMCFAERSSADLGSSRIVQPTRPHLREQDIADDAALMENLLNVPRGHLRPFYQIHRGQHREVMQHIQNPASRFVELYTSQREQTSIIASPWMTRRPDGAELQRGVLFFNVARNGEVVPTIHTGFQEGTLPNRGEEFGQYIDRLATITQPELARRFHSLRLMAV